ncbi:hypothetical protein GCM10023310_16220 [Paenibacillus vulneris]|uniref:GNAT family N-acetyltransferase n=1 Tax=Paenibacillus vulneris TaxID=1133364 RepID=A0ABW3UL15_9BACL
MHDLEWAQDYMEDDARRTALFKLAEQIFGLRMENWYRHAPDNRRYIPFSYFDGGRTIANVSANLLDLVIDGEWKPVIQLGTVMTHPDYRGRGLAGSLMTRVLEHYEGMYDVMYLFANRSVLRFYPKYGFEPVSEQLFILDWSPSKLQLAGEGIGKLDPRNKDDLQFIARMAAARRPVSRRLEPPMPKAS